jgi:hypothetical protein
VLIRSVHPCCRLWLPPTSLLNGQKFEERPALNGCGCGSPAPKMMGRKPARLFGKRLAASGRSEIGRRGSIAQSELKPLRPSIMVLRARRFGFHTASSPRAIRVWLRGRGKRTGRRPPIALSRGRCSFPKPSLAPFGCSCSCPTGRFGSCPAAPDPRIRGRRCHSSGEQSCRGSNPPPPVAQWEQPVGQRPAFLKTAGVKIVGPSVGTGQPLAGPPPGTGMATDRPHPSPQSLTAPQRRW